MMKHAIFEMLITSAHDFFMPGPTRLRNSHLGSSVCASQRTTEMSLVPTKMYTPCAEDQISMLARGVAELFSISWNGC